MKKAALLLTIILFVIEATSAFGQEQVKGGFKKCTESRYSSISGKFDDLTLVNNCSSQYDEKGNMIETIAYYNGAVAYKISYKYDNNGKLIEEINYRSDGSINNRQTYKNDDKGNKIEEVYYNSEGSVTTKREFRFNDNGKKTAEVSYDNKGVFAGNIAYKYNAEGKLYEKIVFSADNYVITKTVSRYDKKGLLVEEESNTNLEKFPTYSPSLKTVIKYDSDDNITDKIVYNPDNTVSCKIAYKYDDKGNNIEVSSFTPAGKMYSKYEHKFNANRIRIEQVLHSYNSEGTETWRESYKYDDLGNQLEKIRFSGLDKAQEKIDYVYSK